MNAPPLMHAERVPCPPTKNNSDKSAFARLRKSSFALAENVQTFVDTVGLENVGVLSVTFPRTVRHPRRASRILNNLARRVLPKLFGERFRAIEPHPSSGRPHTHGLVDCGTDIRAGFNWQHYMKMREWGRDRNRRLVDKPRGRLTENAHLFALWDALRAAAKKYGAGRIELIPLRSSAAAIGSYLGDYLKEGVHVRSRRWKGVRHVSYTRHAPRKIKGPWSWVAGGRSWRRKLARWAAKHGCAEMADVKAVFGPQWCYHHADSIHATDEDAPLPPVPAFVDPFGISPPGRSYTLRPRPAVEQCCQRPLRLSG